MSVYHQMISVILFAAISCSQKEKQFDKPSFNDPLVAQTIKVISLPKGFSYVDAHDPSYADWLLSLKLKETKTVYLYNGNPKANQDAQYGVLDINIGKKDLLQCADAVMKLRADYLFE